MKKLYHSLNSMSNKTYTTIILGLLLASVLLAAACMILYKQQYSLETYLTFRLATLFDKLAVTILFLTVFISGFMHEHGW